MRKPLRLRFALFSSMALLASLADAQTLGINVTGATPSANAVLDVDASGLAGTAAVPKRGMLIPRMSKLQRDNISVTAADEGLWVYVNDDPATYDAAALHGFYYYNGSAWVRWTTGANGWSLSGNSLIADPTLAGNPLYLGTNGGSTNKNLLFRTTTPLTGDPQMQMLGTNGFIGLGTTTGTAVERMDINGAIRVGNTATTNEGTIRYGTNATTPNYNFHYGNDGTSWKKMENAEVLVPSQSFAKDTLECLGATGQVLRGTLTGVGVTGDANTPFPTDNSTPYVFEGFRVQYLYRNSELVQAGICFPATISSVSVYALDDDALGNPPATPPCTITGYIRGGVATGAGLSGTSGTFAGVMDDAIRVSTIRSTFTNLTVSAGWVDFPLSPAITLSAGQNLVLDIAWYRGVATLGVSPRVEVETPAGGYTPTNWVMGSVATSAAFNSAYIATYDNSPVTPTNVPAGSPRMTTGVSSLRPVTRFTANIVTPSTTGGTADYIRYTGGLMVGTPAWAAANFKGPGSIQAQNGVYDGNVQLSDHVFDRYYEGQVRPEEVQQSQGYAYIGLNALRHQLESDRHLANMPSRTEWEQKGGESLGKLQTGLWETVETQALYITQLEKDLSTLEQMTFGNALTTEKAQAMINEIEHSPRLTTAQKLSLTNAVHQRLATPESAPVK